MMARAGLRRGTRASVQAAALLQLDLVCRPGEAVAIAKDWVHRLPKYKSQEAQVAVVFFPSSRGCRDKAKQQDDTIVVGEITGQKWLGELLARRAKPAGRRRRSATPSCCSSSTSGSTRRCSP